jgi:hypothetical protein
MAEKQRYSISQLLNFTKDSYLERTSRPVYAVIFLLPFIAFYEIGTILINTDLLNQSQVRVVAFIWLQNFLEYIGLGSKFAWATPPLAVIIILIALQITSRKQWYFHPSDILPMAVECLLLAFPLIVLSLLLNSSSAGQSNLTDAQANSLVSTCFAATEQDVTEHTVVVPAGRLLFANIITGIGAGIYEELIFRLILICLLMILFQDLLGLEKKTSVILSVLISAALFSVHHHIIIIQGRLATGVPFNWIEFVFRTIAGVYFAALFAIRGFGITAGTHAFYDTIAVLVNAVFFGR